MPKPASIPNTEPEPERCALCHRSGLPLTKHHLIPKARHNKPRTKRLHPETDLHHAVALLCRPCHSTVHHHLTEQQLAEHYPTVEALKQHPDIAHFAAWIANKPPTRQVTTKRPRR
ncbi:MAG: hypothetical protein AAGI68_11975 [Planctomycetota bacterium]